MADNISVNSGSWFLPALFLVFLVLKLTNVITWSWWWVTAPLWGGCVLAIAIMLIVLICMGIGAIIKALLS